MKVRNPFPGIAMIDVCLTLVVAFIVISMLSIMNASVQAQKNIQSDGLYVILVEWPGTSTDDVDTYVQDPARHLVYFRRLQDGLMNLERDDTGANSNEITAPDGTKVRSAINQERVDIRGVLPGEYTVNLHLYRGAGTPVSVTLYKMSSITETIHKADLMLTEEGQEKTAFRFTLTKNGDVTDINTLQKSLTKLN